ncbi:DNA mismatch repair protein [Colletotrichum karsti]|uniref:DNA mismatch repair protein n=1 Tax=Colletotrichum karsti TaxID=1095194 RepID=A0A9P6I0V0_9PEZI|nr:DNA mismatch repair protein [Colletotrichum karsti]KAF9869815.1 DNA mismatch repair protein [Colletotrichum karsti]
MVTTTANRLPNDGAENENQNIKVMRLGSFVDLDCIISIGCAGAILGEVLRMRSAQQIPEVPERAPIAVLQMFVLSDFMLITKDTLSSLQVFQSEIHPSTLVSGAATSGSGSKESLSVYGLFRPLAGTPQGRTKLQQIFVRPLVSLQIINERHRTIEVLLRADNTEALENLSRALQEIKDVRKPLEQLQKGADAQTGTAIDRGVWWSLARFSVRLLRLRDIVFELQHADNLTAVKKVIDTIPVGVMKDVGARIESIIDFDEAKASSRIAVKPNVSRELDDLKRKYHALDSFLNEVRSSMYQTLPDWACPHVTGCVFWPQLGFFTIVSLSPNGAPAYKGQGSDDEDWEVVFITGGNAYCKNCRMVELDAQWGDPYSDIVDLEIQILHALSCDVLQHSLALSRAADACGDLDCLVALARGAQKYGWTAPTMTEENIIAIKGGRHPLQELAVPSFIANDCSLEGGSIDSVHHPETTALIVTGPNHSGKSVYIKQVALIVYLAHLGSFVPADLATIGITDQILTRISTKESVSQNESAFGIDLRQAAFLVRHSTRRSLVLIDEFGKGTSADDGAGLMAGLIDHFTTLGPEAPRTLIATHCHEIFEGDYLLERPGLSLAHMNVRLDLAAAMEDQVVFLLRSRFRDLDARDVYDEAVREAQSDNARNFVVEFNFQEAHVAFDLNADEFGILLDQKPPEGIVRWINIWSPSTQRPSVERIGTHYGFSHRLQALMTSPAKRSPGKFRPAQTFDPSDIEVGLAPSETKALSPSEVPPQALEDVEVYQLVKETMNYTSIDYGRQFLCIGANWLHRRPAVGKPGHKKTLLPPKHWSWLTLCSDSVVLSLHEAPPYEQPDSTEWVLKYLDELNALSSTYFNLTAQKDSQATARLSRSATLLAKLSVFFLPISFMTSYFSVEIPDLVEHYTPKMYWICFAVIAGISFLSLFFFSRLLELLIDVLEGWSDSVWKRFFDKRDERDDH